MAQDALVRAYTHLADLQQGEDFAPWLRRIAVNLSLNVLRRRGRLRFERLDEPPINPSAAPGSEGPPREFADEGQRSPEDEALGAVLRADVEALVRRLPDEQRVAVVLRDIYGYDVAEVATLQGCGLSAAKMRVSRGRAALRRLLETAGVLQAGEPAAAGDSSGVGR